MRDNFNFEDLEPDIVALVLQKCVAMAPGFSEALARQIEQQIKDLHGGRRVYVPKGSKRKTPEQLQALYADGLTAMPTEDLLEKHEISRSTMYRTMKKGGRFGV